MKTRQYIFHGSKGVKNLSPIHFGERYLVTEQFWYKMYEDTPNGRITFENERERLADVADIPNTAKMTDAGDISVGAHDKLVTMLAIEMPFYKGKGLDVIFRSSNPDHLKLEELFTMANDMLTALSKMERKGIIHNDIQPRNIIRTKNGGYLLLDFGNSVQVGEEPDERFIKGTPGYVAEEKKLGKVSVKGDVYSFGKILSDFIHHGEQLGVSYPPDLERIIRKCTEETEPEERYSKFEDLAVAFSSMERKLNEQVNKKAKKQIKIHTKGVGRIINRNKWRYSACGWLSGIFNTLSAVILAAAIIIGGLGTYIMLREDDGTEVLVNGRPSILNDCRVVMHDYKNNTK